MKLRPMYDRVLIKRSESETQSKGGIIIPDNAKEKPIRGEILAVGEGRVMKDGTVRPLQVKPGDVVLFGKYGGTDVQLEGDELLIVREDDILGVFEVE